MASGAPASPYSRIQTAPSPALTGTSLTVESHDGIRFLPVPLPFTLLAWPQSLIPDETNSEELLVTGINEDVFEIVRSPSPLVLEAGMQVAAISWYRLYDIGEHVVLDNEAEGAQLPTSLAVQTPGGEVDTQSNLGTAGTVTASEAGLHRFRWTSALGSTLRRGGFFIRF